MRSLSQRRLLLAAALASFLAVLLPGCASYTSATRKGLEEFDRRDYADADKDYAKADVDGVDQLVYLFDRATVRYEAGRFEDSIKDLKLADNLSEIKDYTSIANGLASIVTNETITPYKGEEFENVLVSMYLALDFVGLHQDENAEVACRQVNRKLELLRTEGKRNYGLNPFAQYLAGLLFERNGDWNTAYVDYKKTFEIDPAFTPIKNDLVRGALEIDSSSDMFKWEKTIGVTQDDIKMNRAALKNTGAVVLLYANGFSPEKYPSRAWAQLPEFRPRPNRHRAAHLYLDGREVARTEVLYDVEKVAEENLKEKYAGLIAKRVGGLVGRAVIANQLDKKAQGLGAIFELAMAASDRPDLRSWLTLPKDFEVARVQVPPGHYHATIRLETEQGTIDGEKDLGPVEVRRAGDVALLTYRSLND